jgi:hypothetical protein
MQAMHGNGVHQRKLVQLIGGKSGRTGKSEYIRGDIVQIVMHIPELNSGLECVSSLYYIPMIHK